MKLKLLLKRAHSLDESELGGEKPTEISNLVTPREVETRMGVIVPTKADKATQTVPQDMPSANDSNEFLYTREEMRHIWSIRQDMNGQGITIEMIEAAKTLTILSARAFHRNASSNNQN